MELTKMSLVELKALAFDVQQDIARSQNNLQIVGQEIEKRLKDVKEDSTEDPKTVTKK